MRRLKLLPILAACVLLLTACQSDYQKGYKEGFQAGYQAAINAQPAARATATAAPRATTQPRTASVSRSSAGSVPEQNREYVLNTSSHVFHLPTCSSVGQMADKNKKVMITTRQQIINLGYSPCQRCKP